MFDAKRVLGPVIAPQSCAAAHAAIVHPLNFARAPEPSDPVGSGGAGSAH